MSRHKSTRMNRRTTARRGVNCKGVLSPPPNTEVVWRGLVTYIAAIAFASLAMKSESSLTRKGTVRP
jgi:hypothetical protein